MDTKPPAGAPPYIVRRIGNLSAETVRREYFKLCVAASASPQWCPSHAATCDAYEALVERVFGVGTEAAPVT